MSINVVVIQVIQAVDWDLDSESGRIDSPGGVVSTPRLYDAWFSRPF